MLESRTNFIQSHIMKYNKLISVLSLSVAVLIMSACGGGGKKESDMSAEEFEKAKADLQENVKKVLYEIPSPAEIPFLLQASGADFDATIINNINKIDSYTALNDKAVLNLGIYSTDIGYLSSYEKTQESLKYMRSCRKLADNVGLSSSFSPELIDEFEKNIESRDSLANLVNETIAKAEDLLKQDDRGNLAALLITGSFIEGLYLSTQIVDNYPNDLPAETRNLILMPLIRMILDQKEPLADLIAMLKGVDQNDRTRSILVSLEGIYGQFDALNIDEQIKNNQANISGATIKGITESIAKLRNDITS
jgi:hypothetical protein